MRNFMAFWLLSLCWFLLLSQLFPNLPQPSCLLPSRCSESPNSKQLQSRNDTAHCTITSDSSKVLSQGESSGKKDFQDIAEIYCSLHKTTWGRQSGIFPKGKDTMPSCTTKTANFK